MEKKHTQVEKSKNTASQALDEERRTEGMFRSLSDSKILPNFISNGNLT